ncbi:TRAP transporter large permease subunit, partial [Brevirhabdus sp.]|uniref:TRAP transporter large permease subunit n=1 Tax=Brevirhabdus sp. TaxID=2004514 RepID=UPI00405894B2
MLMLMIFLALVAMICINVPIAVALALAGVLGLLATEGSDSLVTIALDMYDGSTKFSLIAIPMFVLAGAIMNAGGIVLLSPLGFSPTGEAFNLTMEDVAVSAAIALRAEKLIFL